MIFKKRRIRQQLNKYRQIQSSEKASIPPTPQPATRPPRNTNAVNAATIIAGIILIFGLFWITVSIIQSLDFGSLVFSFGKELKKDSHQHTNFLLAGTGGAEHDGSNLTDTLIIASLDEKNKQVKMLSLPRDLYIDDKLTGGQRINKIYDTYLNKYDASPAAMEKLGETITQLTGVPIHYTVKVNFDGFVKIVDALEGIDLEVEDAIYDPYYPMGETIRFETFSIAAGPQHLDGETALKFARSRKTTSDFDRAKRQQQLLTAIKEKALDLNLLTDPGKLQALYNSLADSIETNLSVAEIIELAKISREITRDSIQSQVLTDDFTSCGGLLYTPVREYFGGAAVLLPAGNNTEELQRFSDNFFNLSFDPATEIQVLNGTKTSGLALNYLNRLSRDCLNVTYYGNAPDREMKKSVIRYLPAATPEEQIKLDNNLKIIQQIIDAPLVDSIPEEYLEEEKRANSKIIIELGADFKTVTSPDAFDNLMYTTPVAPAETEDTVSITPEKPLNSRSTSGTVTPDNSDTTEGNTGAAVEGHTEGAAGGAPPSPTPSPNSTPAAPVPTPAN